LNEYYPEDDEEKKGAEIFLGYQQDEEEKK